MKQEFHEAITEAFGENVGAYNAMTPLSHLGGPREIDDFFDELEFAFSGDLDEHERANMTTIGEAMSWAQAHAAAAEAEEASSNSEDETPSPFAWRDELSFIQKAILKLSGVVGVLMFFLGVQLIVRGKKELGGTLTAAGMFLSTQMFWGLKKCYNWLEKKHLKLLRKIGYKGLFWIFLIGTYTAEVIGLAAVFKFLGLDIPTLPK